MKVVVAMSGGVDSSAVAALLVEQGHKVSGIAMKTHCNSAVSDRACCTNDDMIDARNVADKLGIDFKIINYQSLFQEVVVMPFAEAYRDGLTPNPCVVCNDQVKFRPLLAHAEELGADKLVTGHYARIEEGDEGYELHRGEDRNKDQSYFLYRLSQDQLSKILFPLGGMEKPAVRAHADRLGLGERVSEKTESQEICFVGPEGYAAKVEDILDHKGVPGPGDIVNREGKVLGRHKGIHHHTLGQRRGLGIAASAPLYVQDIKAKENQVVVGFKDELLCESVEVQNLVWPRSHPKDGTQIEIQQRYREYAKAARIWHLDEDRVRIVFDEPTPLGAPGQAAVFYQGSKVVGGGTIAPRSRIGEEGSGAEKS